jgi:hypothetical protein
LVVVVGKIRKFAELNIRKISGGRDPLRVVEEFLLKRGFDPEKCQKEKSSDMARWMVPLKGDEELEILLEGLKKPSDTTLYMGLNIVTVPIRGSSDMLAVALEIADGLIGIKVSLVGHYLVLSSSLSASSLNPEELDYNLRLIEAQESWFRETLTAELQWEDVPVE